MSKKPKTAPRKAKPPAEDKALSRPSSLLDTRVIYCGDCLDQLKNLPDRCIDLIYIDPPFNSNRNPEVFQGATKSAPGNGWEPKGLAT